MIGEGARDWNFFYTNLVELLDSLNYVDKITLLKIKILRKKVDWKRGCGCSPCRILFQRK